MLRVTENFAQNCRPIPNLICKSNYSNGYFTLLTRISTQLAVSFHGQIFTFLEKLEFFRSGDVEK